MRGTSGTSRGRSLLIWKPLSLGIPGCIRQMNSKTFGSEIFDGEGGIGFLSGDQEKSVSTGSDCGV
jgi:hypothetical protein